MFIRSHIIGLVMAGSLFLAGGALAAAGAAIEGTVKDVKGKALKGAEIRIETKNGNSVGKALTDANGRYSYAGLQAGSFYSVTLVVNSAVKASLSNVKMSVGKPQELNFDLKKESQASSTSGKKAKKMVWIPAQTGTNLGGRWVEVYEDGSTQGGVPRSSTAGKGALGNIQGSSSAQRGGGN